MNDWLNDYLREHVASYLPSDYGPQATGPADDMTITVHKMSAFVPISDDLAMDYGLIPDIRPPRKPPTTRERFRWWRSGLRDRISIRIYEWLSGQSFPNEQDWR